MRINKKEGKKSARPRFEQAKSAAQTVGIALFCEISENEQNAKFELNEQNLLIKQSV